MTTMGSCLLATGTPFHHVSFVVTARRQTKRKQSNGGYCINAPASSQRHELGKVRRQIALRPHFVGRFRGPNDFGRQQIELRAKLHESIDQIAARAQNRKLQRRAFHRDIQLHECERRGTGRRVGHESIDRLDSLFFSKDVDCGICVRFAFTYARMTTHPTLDQISCASSRTDSESRVRPRRPTQRFSLPNDLPQWNIVGESIRGRLCQQP